MALRRSGTTCPRQPSRRSINSRFGLIANTLWPWCNGGWEEWYFFSTLPRNLNLSAYFNWGGLSIGDWGTLVDMRDGFDLQKQLETAQPTAVLGEGLSEGTRGDLTHKAMTLRFALMNQLPRSCGVMLGRRTVVSLVLLCAVLGVRAPATLADTRAPAIDELLTAYAAGDYQALRNAVSSGARYEELRKELGVVKDGQFRGAMQRWHPQRRPVHSAFMLELAFLGRQRGFSGWLDVLAEARKFLVARPEPPGASPEADAFELTWHRAAMALLHGMRRDLLEEHGIRPLAERITKGPAAAGKLTAPWFALASGVAEEQWAKVPGADSGVRHAAALKYYTEAARHESTRREALVRKAGVLLAMQAPADAIAALHGADEEGTDTGVTYWRWLFIGRAHQALDRLTEAEAAYERARRVTPEAQSPKVALAALALRRDDRARAFELAQAIRTAPADAEDPWWEYYTGEYRLLGPRLAAVRRMAGK